MKRAFVNGIILDGTENMIPQYKKEGKDTTDVLNNFMQYIKKPCE